VTKIRDADARRKPPKTLWNTPKVVVT
jgi:hypothetical protein